jgi:hypothetical protein
LGADNEQANPNPILLVGVMMMLMIAKIKRNIKA